MVLKLNPVQFDSTDLDMDLLKLNWGPIPFLKVNRLSLECYWDSAESPSNLMVYLVEATINPIVCRRVALN